MKEKTSERESRVMMWRGIDLCRQGHWEKGLELLRRVAAADPKRPGLPGRFYSYLGYGLARFEQRHKQGVTLCRYAVKVEPEEVENHLNLARLYLFRGNRRGAWKSLRRGREVNPSHRGLDQFERELDERRPPVVRFLPRTHPINRWCGRLRHRLTSRAEPATGGPT